MAKYQVRLNIIKKGEIGEGNFWWMDEEELKDAQVFTDTKYGINPRHWSTLALEIFPCSILPKMTNKKWEVIYHSENDDCVMAKYESEDGDVSLLELCDENGFISLRWDEEDRLPKNGPSLTVFCNGKSIPCSNAREAAATVCSEIFSRAVVLTTLTSQQSAGKR